jgi:hypothetical protein
MKKKITLALFVLAVAMFAAVPATFADSVLMEISFNGGGSWTTLCSNPTGGFCSFAAFGPTNGLTIAGGNTNANFPGTSTEAISDTSSIALTATSNVSFLIRTTATGFTAPTGAGLTLDVQESTTNPAGSFDFTTTGSLVGACSATTATLHGLGSAEAQSACSNNTTPFTLETLSSYSLVAGSHLNDTTTVKISNVPEPASIMMFGSGVLGFAGMIRRKLNK